jgi:hypothetical protein
MIYMLGGIIRAEGLRAVEVCGGSITERIFVSAKGLLV